MKKDAATFELLVTGQDSAKINKRYFSNGGAELAQNDLNPPLRTQPTLEVVELEKVKTTLADLTPPTR